MEYSGHSCSARRMLLVGHIRSTFEMALFHQMAGKEMSVVAGNCCMHKAVALWKTRRVVSGNEFSAALPDSIRSMCRINNSLLNTCLKLLSHT